MTTYNFEELPERAAALLQAIRTNHKTPDEIKEFINTHEQYIIGRHFTEITDPRSGKSMFIHYDMLSAIMVEPMGFQNLVLQIVVYDDKLEYLANVAHANDLKEQGQLNAHLADLHIEVLTEIATHYIK